MKPIYQRDPFKVGIVAIIVGLVLCLGVVMLSVVSFGTRDYKAYLAQTAGLRKGEDVTVHGVQQGKVRKIELAGDKVLVTFALSKDIDLGASTRADVKVATLLGTHYLEVRPSGAGSLPNGTIPMSQTSVPFNLQDVIEQGTTALNKLDSKGIATALTQMSKTFDAANPQLGPALVGVTRLSQVVSNHEQQGAALLRATKSVSDQLSASSADLVGLMKSANLVINEITARRQAIHSLLVQTTEISRNLTAIVNGTRTDLGPAFRKFNDVLGVLRSEDASLRQLLDVAAPAVRYVANATGTGPWIDLSIFPLPPDDVYCKTGC